MASNPKASVKMPFETGGGEGQSDPQAIVPDEKKEGEGGGAFAPPTTEKKTRKRRQKKIKKDESFVISSKEGIFICEKADIIDTVKGKTDVEIFLISKKVKSIHVVPSKRDLLNGGDVTADKVEIKYE